MFTLFCVSLGRHTEAGAFFAGFSARNPTPDTTGSDPQLYDEAALDARRGWALARPTSYPMPVQADQLRSLGGIARLLGVDGKTVSQSLNANAQTGHLTHRRQLERDG
ncbi:hypothetical protein EDD27_5369 [Nonomuraea polychroma]|uniref:Uncharacterized protein n=1 Tax=Nonomuraea polychroma TaxID=46176 RepID=A0A438MAM1_9ACTN|nr:hypothetical protein [Nonomuraea polychroma]RVX42721.1 hypothetical protein EDD27_5369 [Nonomuraea polychroma]